MDNKYSKVIIELEFDTFKPDEDDVFNYIRDLYEDNSLDYKILNSKGIEVAKWKEFRKASRKQQAASALKRTQLKSRIKIERKRI